MKWKVGTRKRVNNYRLSNSLSEVDDESIALCVNHTSWVAVVTPTDRPKSIRNRCLI